MGQPRPRLSVSCWKKLAFHLPTLPGRHSYIQQRWSVTKQVIPADVQEAYTKSRRVKCQSKLKLVSAVDRYRHCKRYVRRDSKGQFNESDDQSRSLGQDVRQEAKTKVKPGQGDRGDQKRK